MFKKILITFVVIIALILGYVAVQPSEFKITRSMEIAAPAEIVFAQVNNFHKWEAWSPWAKMDPNAKATFEGPEAGTGASMAWAGNDQVGEGRMTITESQAPERILIDLQFIKPWEAKNLTEFTFKAEAATTLVTWTMSGTNNFVGKLFCVFMNMDKMVGADFEKGLTAMKAVAETEAQTHAAN